MKEIALNKVRDLFDDIIKDRKTLVKIMSVVLILLVAAVLRISAANKPDVNIEHATASVESSEDQGDDPARMTVCVDIGGQVVNPGVYQVNESTRLYQLIELAGGLTELADPDAINQASYVEDGEKIIIPAKNSAIDPAEGSSSSEIVSNVSAISSSGIVNINSANKEELMTLNGIGEVMAERIIEYRASNRFKKKEDIKSVKGIGDGIFAKIKDDITC